jgi:hypothetical protein
MLAIMVTGSSTLESGATFAEVGEVRSPEEGSDVPPAPYGSAEVGGAGVIPGGDPLDRVGRSAGRHAIRDPPVDGRDRRPVPRCGRAEADVGGSVRATASSS